MKLTVEQIAVKLASRQILHDISLTIHPGEMVGLIGPNGSGKSTLLRTIYRLLRLIAGQIWLDTQEVWQLSARASSQRTGVVLQDGGDGFEFTVREVVQMGRTPHRAYLPLTRIPIARLSRRHWPKSRC